MFPKQLQKILELIKKTGDRVILYDENKPDNSYAILDFESYSSLVSKQEEKTLNREDNRDLTMNDLTDKINCDISSWKNQENGNYLAEESKSRNPWAIPSKVKNGAQKIE